MKGAGRFPQGHVRHRSEGRRLGIRIRTPCDDCAASNRNKEAGRHRIGPRPYFPVRTANSADGRESFRIRRSPLAGQKSVASPKNPLQFGGLKSSQGGTERWPSGRRRSPAKGVYRKRYRGFESLLLRHFLACPKRADRQIPSSPANTIVASAGHSARNRFTRFPAPILPAA